MTSTVGVFCSDGQSQVHDLPPECAFREYTLGAVTQFMVTVHESSISSQIHHNQVVWSSEGLWTSDIVLVSFIPFLYMWNLGLHLASSSPVSCVVSNGSWGAKMATYRSWHADLVLVTRVSNRTGGE